MAGDDAGFVGPGSDAALLDKRVDLSIDKRSIGGENADRNDGRIAQRARKPHSVRRAEVAQAVGDKAALVHFDAARHVRAVTVDDGRTIVDAEVREAAEVTPVLAEEGLGALWEMPFIAPLRASVKRHDDDVGMLFQSIQNSLA